MLSQLGEDFPEELKLVRAGLQDWFQCKQFLRRLFGGMSSPRICMSLESMTHTLRRTRNGNARLPQGIDHQITCFPKAHAAAQARYTKTVMLQKRQCLGLA
eukprot:3616217-Amphidinium_carterae.3